LFYFHLFLKKYNNKKHLESNSFIFIYLYYPKTREKGGMRIDKGKKKTTEKDMGATKS